MKRHLVLFALLIALAACATPQVTMPSGVASVMYAHAYGDYQIAKVYVMSACASGRFDKETCEVARQIDIRAKVYKDNIEKALMDPTQPIDWGQVMQFSETAINLILKLGLMP